jgi:hypothetical protein
MTLILNSLILSIIESTAMNLLTFFAFIDDTEQIERKLNF